MLVKEAYENLKKLVEAGHGDVVLMGRDCRSGDSSEAGISNTVSEVDGTEDCGDLCDYDVGEKFVSVYMG